MNTHEHPWTPMNTHEHPWTPMNLHEIQKNEIQMDYEKMS